MGLAVEVAVSTGLKRETGGLHLWFPLSASSCLRGKGLGLEDLQVPDLNFCDQRGASRWRGYKNPAKSPAQESVLVGRRWGPSS